MAPAPVTLVSVFSEAWDAYSNTGHRFNMLFPNLGASVLVRAGGGGRRPRDVDSQHTLGWIAHPLCVDAARASFA
jgi:hypothetical protein